MNNSLKTLIASCAIAVSAAVAPAFCGELEPLHVTVPFAFTAGSKTLPAGEYVVGSESGVVTIRGSHGGAILLSAAGQEMDGERCGVSFAHTDKGFFLKEVHSFGHSTSLLRVSALSEK